MDGTLATPVLRLTRIFCPVSNGKSKSTNVKGPLPSVPLVAMAATRQCPLSIANKIESMLDACAKDGYRIRDLILALVQSRVSQFESSRLIISWSDQA